MEGKVLIYVRDLQLGRWILSWASVNHVPFVECYRDMDLEYRANLIKENNKLFVYEFLDEDHEAQFLMLQKMSESGFKILVVFPEYRIQFIDEGMKVGVDDMLVHPIEMPILSSKLSKLLQLPVDEPEPEPEEVQTMDYMVTVEREIRRAKRGHYELSFVMFSFVSSADSHLEEFFDVMKSTLRETDILLHINAANRYLVVCPFTKKEYIVEVENKIRDVFHFMKQRGQFTSHSKVYVHGLTLGEDGMDFKELMEKMENGIEGSKSIDQLGSRNKPRVYSNPKAFKAYGRHYRWN